MSKATILFYISGHGYGHAVRDSFLINKIPETYNVLIITPIPQSLFEEEIERQFEWRYGQFDLGCVQRDALTVDVQATIREYTAISERNESTLSDELALVETMRPVALVSDIVPFVSEIAVRLQIPSFAISNFSWYETYEQYFGAGHPVLQQMYEQYRRFDYWIRLTPGTILPKSFTGRETLTDVALLRKGEQNRSAICNYYGLEESKKVVLLYTGTYGLDRVEWKKLEQFPEVEFVGYYPLPVPVENFTLVKKDLFTLQDFSASADLIISKLGYGTVTESLSSGTPLLYVPRENFIEYPALKSDLESLGCCTLISEKRFHKLDIGVEMSALLQKRGNNVLNDSSALIAQWILDRIDPNFVTEK